MRQFLNSIKLARSLRKKIEGKILQANKNFALARALMSKEAINTALMCPKQEINIEIKTRNIMSVEVPEFKYKTKTPDKNDIFSYGYAFTSCELDFAISSLSEVLEDMILLAQYEKSCRLMSDEIEKTRRRVNALEHVMIPEICENIKYIKMKLDENERSTQVRLIKVKNLIIKEKLSKKKSNLLKAP